MAAASRIETDVGTVLLGRRSYQRLVYPATVAVFAVTVGLPAAAQLVDAGVGPAVGIGLGGLLALFLGVLLPYRGHGLVSSVLVAGGAGAGYGLYMILFETTPAAFPVVEFLLFTGVVATVFGTVCFDVGMIARTILERGAPEVPARTVAIVHCGAIAVAGVLVVALLQAPVLL
jgi:hypothetical protein